MKHNQSQILTYNFAYSGATVNKSLVDSNIDVSTQILSQFAPKYTQNTSIWDNRSSLFAIWIGINDIGKSYSTKNSTNLHNRVFADYRRLVDVLYEKGARNFLFLNVPPLHRAPRTVNSSNNATLVPLQKKAVQDWNDRLLHMVHEMERDRKDAKISHYDTYRLFNTVLDDPNSFPETSVYKSTSYCVAYER